MLSDRQAVPSLKHVVQCLILCPPAAISTTSAWSMQNKQITEIDKRLNSCGSLADRRFPAAKDSRNYQNTADPHREFNFVSVSKSNQIYILDLAFKILRHCMTSDIKETSPWVSGPRPRASPVSSPHIQDLSAIDKNKKNVYFVLVLLSTHNLG